MSKRHQKALATARDAIRRMLVELEAGTDERPRKLTKYELALEHAEAWAADQPPKAGERGGSSNPRDASDRREDVGVQRRAAQAVSRLTQNALTLEYLAVSMERDVIFLTAITDDDPDEEAGELSGCRSCARIGIRSGVYEKSKALGLCRWCWEHRPTEDQLPPLELCRLHHDGTKSEVSKWLAKHMPAVKRDDAPSCATTFFTTSAVSKDGTHEFHCHRAQGHDGEHASVDRQGNRVVPAMSAA